MRLFNFVKTLFWRYAASPIKYAEHVGVKVGKHTTISIREWSSEPYLVTIGSHVQITRGVSIHTHGGGNAVRKEVPDFDVFGKVTIEDWCYIGAYSQIMPGVTIGEGSLVAAGSIVTKSVPPHCVVGGNPARILCSIDDYIAKNGKFNVHSKGMSSIEKKEYLLSLDDSHFLKK